jgi:hypothetical protein
MKLKNGNMMTTNKTLIDELRVISKYFEASGAAGCAESVISAIETIETLEKALGIYQRERDRFRHAKPEITGEYFLSGGHGQKDDNLLPQFVRVVPAYGCAFEVVYEKTDKTITYEGS